MLEIDLEDVYAVLALCVPYLVVIGVALVAMVVAMVLLKPATLVRKYWK